MGGNEFGFYEVLQYKREGDLFKDMLILQKEMERLKADNVQMKDMIIKSNLQMQEIYLELLKERSNRS